MGFTRFAFASTMASHAAESPAGPRSAGLAKQLLALRTRTIVELIRSARRKSG